MSGRMFAGLHVRSCEALTPRFLEVQDEIHPWRTARYWIGALVYHVMHAFCMVTYENRFREQGPFTNDNT